MDKIKPKFQEGEEIFYCPTKTVDTREGVLEGYRAKIVKISYSLVGVETPFPVYRLILISRDLYLNSPEVKLVSISTPNVREIV